jgi:P-type E1-E2 ATPase
MKFVFLMGLVAIAGFFGCLKKMIGLEYEKLSIVANLFNCIVIAVPPGLPAAASCGLLFAISRLKKQQIFCISPPRVNSAGRITRFVFDKTGTITEEGLTVLGYRPVLEGGPNKFEDLAIPYRMDPIDTAASMPKPERSSVLIKKITSRKTENEGNEAVEIIDQNPII